MILQDIEYESGVVFFHMKGDEFFKFKCSGFHVGFLGSGFMLPSTFMEKWQKA